jgi:2-haloacid dehalogenase
VEPALRLLSEAGVPAHAFTHGSAEVAQAALTGAGVRTLLRGVHSAEVIAAFKPPARVYHWVCAEVGSEPARTALVAAHAWDCHGAGRAGLRTGYVTRLEGEHPAVFDEPTFSSPTLDGVVRALLDA